MSVYVAPVARRSRAVECLWRKWPLRPGCLGGSNHSAAHGRPPRTDNPHRTAPGAAAPAARDRGEGGCWPIWSAGWRGGSRRWLRPPRTSEASGVAHPLSSPASPAACSATGGTLDLHLDRDHGPGARPRRGVGDNSAVPLIPVNEICAAGASTVPMRHVR